MVAAQKIPGCPITFVTEVLEDGIWVDYTASNVNKVISAFDSTVGAFTIAHGGTISEPDKLLFEPSTTFSMRSTWTSTGSGFQLQDDYSISVRHLCSDGVLIKEEELTF